MAPARLMERLGHAGGAKIQPLKRASPVVQDADRAVRRITAARGERNAQATASGAGSGAQGPGVEGG